MKLSSSTFFFALFVLVSFSSCEIEVYSDDPNNLRFNVQSVEIYAEAPGFDLNEPDIYFKVLDANRNKVYESGCDRNQVATIFYPNLVLNRYETYTFEIWDHDFIGDHDMITQFSVNISNRDIYISNYDAELTVIGNFIE